jgi:hypoxanthine phosphoribosyltransferase
MSEEITYEAPTWDELYKMTLELADKLKEDGFKPDIIVGVSRGGWPPARIMSDLLDNPNLANVKVEFYKDIYQTAEEPRITQPVSVPVKGKDILIVDDIADTGKSLKLVREKLLEEEAAEVRIATLYLKPWSITIPDFYVKTTSAWVCFSWELYESVKKIGGKMKTEGKQLSEIEEFLISIGLEPFIVRKFAREIFEEE